MKPDARARSHPAYWAFVVHRVSGIALALFLPLHFWLLSRSLAGADALESALRWVDRPGFKLAEWGLVVLLATHLAGGVRVLMLELLPWRAWQKSLIGVGILVTIIAGLAMAMNLATL